MVNAGPDRIRCPLHTTVDRTRRGEFSACDVRFEACRAAKGFFPFSRTSLRSRSYASSVRRKGLRPALNDVFRAKIVAKFSLVRVESSHYLAGKRPPPNPREPIIRGCLERAEISASVPTLMRPVRCSLCCRGLDPRCRREI